MESLYKTRTSLSAAERWEDFLPLSERLQEPSRHGYVTPGLTSGAANVELEITDGNVNVPILSSFETKKQSARNLKRDVAPTSHLCLTM